MDEKKVTASDILFENVYQISEEMIQTTYQLVEDASKFCNTFDELSQRLIELNGKLSKHIVKAKWIQESDKKRCKEKITKAKELSNVCRKYSKICKLATDDLITTTEQFEANKKLQDIIKNLVDKIEQETQDAKEAKNDPPPEEEED